MASYELITIYFEDMKGNYSNIFSEMLRKRLIITVIPSH